MESKQERHPFYPERPFEGLDQSLETLGKPPEVALLPEERNEVLRRESLLTVSTDLNHDLQYLGNEKVVGVENIYKRKVNTAKLYIDYFLTPEGKEVARSMGIDNEKVDEAKTIDDVREYLLSFDYSKLSGPRASEIEKLSTNFIEKRTADQFAKNDFQSLEGIENPTQLLVVRNPNVLANNIEDLRRLKRYIKAYEKTLTGNDNTTRGNKLMALIHRRRVNEMIASLYPEAQSFLLQAKATGRATDLELARRISNSMKAIKSFSGSRALRNFARLDMFLNGVGEMEKGEYQQLAHEALELADEVSKPVVESKPDDYRYKGYEEKWKNLKVGPEEFREWGEKVLRARGILSDSPHTSYNPDRDGAPFDKKWQAVFIPGKGSLAVNHRQKVMKFPKEGERSFAGVGPPAGAVPVLNHEERHVLQDVNKEKIGLSITSEVGMDRYSLLAEGGGLEAEIETQLSEFGQNRNVNADYIRAAQARLKGGGYKEVFKAFFDSMIVKNPNTSKEKAASQAANRALRIFRSGGQTSDASRHFTHSGSGTLEYLEQELVARKIRNTKFSKLFFLSGVNVEMLAELHKIGMFDIDSVWVPEEKASDLIRDEIDKKLGIISKTIPTPNNY